MKKKSIKSSFLCIDDDEHLDSLQPSYIAGTIYRALPQSETKRIRLDIGEQERFESDFNKQSPKS